MTDRTEVEDVAGAGGPLLRLLALDAEDLSVVSAHAQDAVVRWNDLAFLPTERRFLLILDRFDWCAAEDGRSERLTAGLHFESVSRVTHLGIAAHAPPAALTLLSISFQETDPPAGQIFLTFAENVVIRLDVECLEAQLRDLGPRRAAEQPPSRDKTRASTSDAR